MRPPGRRASDCANAVLAPGPGPANLLTRTSPSARPACPTSAQRWRSPCAKCVWIASSANQSVPGRGSRNVARAEWVDARDLAARSPPAPGPRHSNTRHRTASSRGEELPPSSGAVGSVAPSAAWWKHVHLVPQLLTPVGHPRLNCSGRAARLASRAAIRSRSRSRTRAPTCWPRWKAGEPGVVLRTSALPTSAMPPMQPRAELSQHVARGEETAM